MIAIHVINNIFQIEKRSYINTIVKVFGFELYNKIKLIDKEAMRNDEKFK
jgi:hypothetical protein